MRSGSWKVLGGFSPASAGVENATAESKASRSTAGEPFDRKDSVAGGGGVSVREHCESSPASAGMELTASFCLENCFAALRAESFYL